MRWIASAKNPPIRQKYFMQTKCVDDTQHHRIYNEEFDAYHCIKCNQWLEKQCSDSNCEFCSKRPEKPPNKKTKCESEK